MLKGERVPHDALEIQMGRGAELHGVITAEHQVMGLEGTLCDCLTNFFEIDPRGDAHRF
jgi:hypothetical protein